jgi:hypothetical protein
MTNGELVEFWIEGVRFSVMEHDRLGLMLWVGDPCEKHTYVGMRREIMDFADVLPMHIAKIAEEYRNEGLPKRPPCVAL